MLSGKWPKLMSSYICTCERTIFKIIQRLKDEIFQLVTQAYSEKEILSAPSRSQTYDLPIRTSDALPLSYRRLVVPRPLN